MRSIFRPALCAILLLAPAASWAAFMKNAPGLFLETEAQTPITPPATGPVEKDPPIVLGAEELAYDQKNGIVIARGKVEVQQGNYVVLADQVTYFQKHDTVIAEGNVSIMQPTGDVVFSDRAKLNDALKTGVIDAFRARLSDNSVLVAEKAVRTSPSSTNLSKVEYTPCNLCEGMAPFWQLNAKKVNLDQLNDRVTYQDATMDIKGVPIFYTPYLSHPTPDAPAKSGFLPPQYGANSNLGTFARVPYYWRIDHDSEATITPWYSTSEGLLVQGNYRQRLDNGEYDIQASGTNPERLDAAGNAVGGNEFRGHIFAKGYQNTGDYSRVGFDIQRTTDDTFLRRYSLGDQRVLFSRLYAEAAEGRNFASAQGLSIQGLRLTDDRKTTPFVLPMLQGYYETTPDDNGIRYHVSGDAQALSRSVGIDQRRLSSTVGATLPYITDGGHVFTSTLNLRQDLYQTDNISKNGQLADATNYRVMPQAAVEWRYPLINHLDGNTLTLEPVVLAVLQPRGGNPSDISNEDNRLLELTDTNLFSLDRMPGLDEIDSGPRVAYGARGQYLFSNGTNIDALLGQNYNPNSNTPFPNSTSANQDFSDYIGRIAVNYAPITLAYRVALDKEGLGFNRNEISLQFAKPWLTVATSYRSIRNNSYVIDSEEGDASITLPLSDSWSLYGAARRNFTLDQFVSAGSGVVFKNECFNVGFDTLRIFTRDRDVEPTTQYMLRVAFKNLGEFGGR